MSEEEMISEIEIYLSHVIAKDFPLPKAVKLMYEEYKNSNKAWEKIYDEDQNYIFELNDKILDLEFKIKKQQKEIEELKEENKELKEENQAYNYLEKYIEWETLGERNLEGDIKTILDLVEKQQKEIEKLKDELKELQHFKEEVIDIIKYADDTAEPTYWNIRKLLGDENNE